MVARRSVELSAEPAEPAEPSARAGTYSDPPRPLPPELRSDVAYRRACGHSWDAVGVALRYHPDALRRAAEADPEFAAAQERAWAEVTWEAEADAMRRLRQLADGADDARALEAAEVLVRYARERRRDETRLAVERMRAETRLEVERMKADRRPDPDGAAADPPPVPVAEPVPMAEPVPAVERASAAGAEVFLWGGRHPTGQGVGPDASDAPVRVVPDWSCGLGARGVIYWVVPASARERVPDTGILFPAGASAAGERL